LYDALSALVATHDAPAVLCSHSINPEIRGTLSPLGGLSARSLVC
jgi:hypothetical protein